MFGTFTLATLLVSALVARADVTPIEPGPAIICEVGQTCHVAWNGDVVSPTAWKGMAIQLMTGDNFNMVALTTVGTNLDGTTNGTFDHKCPDVTLYAPIYFYQFSAPGATNKTWTTRFTIVSPTSTPVPAPNVESTDPPVFWGTGALKDPSQAVAAPSFIGSPVVTATSGVTTPALGAPSTTDLTPTSTSVPLLTPTPNSSRFTTVVVSTSIVSVAGSSSPTSPTSGNNNNTTASPSKQDNGSLAAGLNAAAWQVAVSLGATAMALIAML